MQQYDFQDGMDDYAERVYIYNSVAFKISDSAQFVVDENGVRSIETFGVVPVGDENFDFISSNPVAIFGNLYLESEIDPFNAGTVVAIKFDGDVNTFTYTSEDFAADQSLINSWNGFDKDKLLSDMNDIIDQLNNSGLTKIITGSNDADSLNLPLAVLDINTIVTGDGNDTLSLIGNSNEAVQIFLGNGDDNISGGYTKGLIDGGAGNDTIAGAFGNDKLYGGAGNDVINASDGNDTINGGDGIDLISYENILTGVNANLNSKTASFGGFTQKLDAIENIITGSGNDTLTGDSKNNFFNAGAGNDSLNGDFGNDILIGGDGADTLNGSVGSDILTGGAGVDRFTGHPGGDDLVTDFSRAEGDVVDLGLLIIVQSPMQKFSYRL